MNDTDELERRISERLHGHSRLAPDADGWEGILDRIEQRGRARHRRRAAATGLVLAGMVGSLVVLTGGDGTRVSTDPGPPAAGTAGTAATSTAGGLPRLLLDVPGFEVTNAHGTVDSTPYPDLGDLLVYGAPGDGPLGPGPVLFARLVPAGAAYGIGDGPDLRPVDVAGRPGRLLRTDGAAASLGWPRADGSIVHLIALGIPDDDLVAAGQAVEGALALGPAPPPTLPGGLALRRATPADTSPSSQAEASYGSGGRYIGLRITSGDTYRLDDLLLDRLASSGGWRPVTVNGRAGVLSTYQQPGDSGDADRTLLWSPREGVVAEVISQGLTEAELEAAAASIHEVDEATWNDLVAMFGSPPPVSTVTPVDDQLAQVGAEICRLRNRWLEAHAAGDGGLEAAAGADLASVLEKGRAAGLGNESDILMVAERLLDAMAAGDAGAVSSIPEGGGCS